MQLRRETFQNEAYSSRRKTTWTSKTPTKSPAELHGGDGGDDDDDDVPTLSPYALEALKEFLATSQPPPSAKSVAGELSQAVALPKEDWRLSQFWYSPDTATTVADEVHSLLTSHFSGVDTSVACLACPTLFAYLKKMYPNMSVQLLEYDKRFEQYGSDFTFYDYNLPKELPQEMKHNYQIVVADPPYLVRTELVQLKLSIVAPPTPLGPPLRVGGIFSRRQLTGFGNFSEKLRVSCLFLAYGLLLTIDVLKNSLWALAYYEFCLDEL